MATKEMVVIQTDKLLSHIRDLIGNHEQCAGSYALEALTGNKEEKQKYESLARADQAKAVALTSLKSYINHTSEYVKVEVKEEDTN